ncbi:DNA N6-methyl methyltransferase-like [Penaeus japonicus]|uniref:DNA N6-methyl methyltransferase-like n=1 Tax=Penaeus japonicus TaxID=27405 RepID=UPI001C7137EE|nr:DNA N6-methyl methyltransferase-like [Penaeus japonicus]XP_042867108.1 DNA N6-methyl methyltransferase-like [Penaeus japonicus]
MAVIYAEKESAILDHELWMLQRYCSREEVNLSGNRKKFQVLFDLRTPFLMDGQAEKIAAQLEGKETKLRKRKREHKTTTPEDEYEEKLIQEMFAALRLTPKFKEKFCYIPSSEDYRRNNSLIRETRKRFTDISNLTLPLLDESHKSADIGIREIENHKFLLPPHVRYICDDVNNLLSHMSGDLFDVVVMDPPWLNKYVKRRCLAHGNHHGYDMMTVSDILALPVGEILSPDAIVAIWCTNNASILEEFIQGLHKWGVHLIATWYWLKVTKAGEPVTPFPASHGKRPYERLLVASRCAKYKDTIPERFVICSVPSGIHSHKPPLEELLKRFSVPEPRCLELFCRSLLPGWTCYGLEVLRLNHLSLFEDETK